MSNKIDDEYIIDEEYDSEDEKETLEDVYEYLQDDIMWHVRIMYQKMRYEIPWLLDRCDFLTFFKFVMLYNKNLQFLEKINRRDS